MQRQSWLQRITSTFRAGAPADEPRDIDIQVRGGYQPDEIAAREGERVRVTFLRSDKSGCTSEVVFPSLGIRKTLPTGVPVEVELGPLPAGTLEFACGMDMVHGRIVVSPAA